MPSFAVKMPTKVAHAALLRLALRRLVDAEVRELDPGDEPVFLVTLGAVHLVGPRPLGIALRRSEELLQRLERHLGRDLACRVATHPIGDQKQTVVRHDREVVLVVIPLPADVGLSGHFDPECRGVVHVGRDRDGRGVRPPGQVRSAPTSAKSALRGERVQDRRFTSAY